ncbi:MAG: hypothetical protein A2Y60_03505 [Chloroflexi bacterium RBG_13_54_9]|nr:MAG: hypothetical protein A2Y60_03505 [Chloroflexi bacterium RBG_13_54_9]
MVHRCILDGGIYTICCYHSQKGHSVESEVGAYVAHLGIDKIHKRSSLEKIGLVVLIQAPSIFLGQYHRRD